MAISTMEDIPPSLTILIRDSQLLRGENWGDVLASTRLVSRPEA